MNSSQAKLSIYNRTNETKLPIFRLVSAQNKKERERVTFVYGCNL
jgi:hypothetical protein